MYINWGFHLKKKIKTELFSNTKKLTLLTLVCTLSNDAAAAARVSSPGYKQVNVKNEALRICIAETNLALRQ
jgi:hypothetical protein